jgi:hypothetical protein
MNRCEGILSSMAIWTKPLARRTLPRVRGAAVSEEARFSLRRVVTCCCAKTFLLDETRQLAWLRR